MDGSLIAPRDLSEDEIANIRDLLKSMLVISNDDDEEDAENLLDYAVDMIESGENIDHVTEELKFMEMPVCDEDAAQMLGECLTTFFLDLDGGTEGGGASSVEGEEKSSKAEEEEAAAAAAAAAAPVTPEPEQEPEPEPEPEPVRAAPAPAPKPKPTSFRTVSTSKPSYTPRSYSGSSSHASSSASSSGGGGNSSTSWMKSGNSGPGADPYNCKSSADRRSQEMKDMFGSGGGGPTSVKDRMKAFNNNTKVNFDPVHFAVNQNKREKVLVTVASTLL
mmetsp:Transcript_10526/g.18485  ORF Transcript_10526/g.18485 Transcript_10526/m.18485 type:complete len:277 (-) Transcript_10526:445-1275(-)